MPDALVGMDGKNARDVFSPLAKVRAFYLASRMRYAVKNVVAISKSPIRGKQISDFCGLVKTSFVYARRVQWDRHDYCGLGDGNAPLVGVRNKKIGAYRSDVAYAVVFVHMKKLADCFFLIGEDGNQTRKRRFFAAGLADNSGAVSERTYRARGRKRFCGKYEAARGA